MVRRDSGARPGSQMLPKIAFVVVDPACPKEFQIFLLKDSFTMVFFLPFNIGRHSSLPIRGASIQTPIPGVPGRKKKRRPSTPGYDSDTASR